MPNMIEVDVQELLDLAKGFSPEGRKRAAYNKIKAQIALGVGEIVSGSVRAFTPVDRAFLRGNIRPNPRRLTSTILGRVITIKVQAEPPGSRYAPVVEAGRRPGQRWPPLKAILGWVRRKTRRIAGPDVGPATSVAELQGLIQAGVREVRGPARRFDLNTAPSGVDQKAWNKIPKRKKERIVAFLIQRKIGIKGTKGAQMFKKGRKAAEPRIDRFLAAMRTRLVRELER